MYTDIEHKVREIVGEHYDLLFAETKLSGEWMVDIFPKDYIKVEGGMMYKSVASILKDLVDRGIYFSSVENLYQR